MEVVCINIKIDYEDKKKYKNISVRVPVELYEAFNLSCDKLDTDKSKVLRKLMEKYCVDVSGAQLVPGRGYRLKL